MKRIQLVGFGVLLAICLWELFSFISSRYTLAYAQPQHKCFPYRVWLIDKRYTKIADFKYGDFVAFKGKNIPYMKDGIKWIKQLIGKPGDTVTVHFNKDRVFRTILVNDMPVTKLVRACVTIINKEAKKYNLDAFDTDTKNRPIPVISSTVIGSSEIFVYSPHERSYDSRYWGLVNENQIIGKAYPVF